MGRVLFAMAMSLVCLQATPFIALDRLTSLTIALPASLGDLDTTAAVDRSPEMGETDAIVASPQMISSVQLSFDARFDLGGRSIGGTEGFFDARRQAPYARNIDRRQVDLTLGVAIKGFESETVGGAQQERQLAPVHRQIATPHGFEERLHAVREAHQLAHVEHSDAALDRMGRAEDGIERLRVVRFPFQAKQSRFEFLEKLSRLFKERVPEPAEI
jgi:hypothetical protein